MSQESVPYETEDLEKQTIEDEEQRAESGLPTYPLKNLTPLEKGVFLGLDWGKKRCGLAISDPLRQFAMPLEVVKPGGVLRHILLELWQERQVAALIIGWPLSSRGAPSPLALTIQRLAYRLSTDHGWPIALVDETLSSCDAQDKYENNDLKKNEGHGKNRRPSYLKDNSFNQPQKTTLDHVAAASILQGALDQWNILHIP